MNAADQNSSLTFCFFCVKTKEKDSLNFTNIALFHLT